MIKINSYMMYEDVIKIEIEIGKTCLNRLIDVNLFNKLSTNELKTQAVKLYLQDLQDLSEFIEYKNEIIKNVRDRIEGKYINHVVTCFNMKVNEV